VRTHRHAYARRIYVHAFRTGIGTLKLFAFSSDMDAYYAISIRQASALPAASFRFHLTMNTLAVRLTVPPAGRTKKAPVRTDRLILITMGYLGFAFQLEILLLPAYLQDG
jgi:hypothetical protein